MRDVARVLMLVIAAALPQANSLGQDPAPKPPPTSMDEAWAAMSATRVSADFTDVPLDVIMDFVRSRSGMNLVLDKKIAREILEKPLVLRLESIALSDLFRTILRFAGLRVLFRHGAVFVTSYDKAGAPLETRTINIGRLVQAPLDSPGMVRDLFNACNPDLASLTEAYSDYQESCRISPEDLMTFIMDNVDSESWCHQGASLQVMDKILLATNTAEAIAGAKAAVEMLGREVTCDMRLLVRVVQLDFAGLAALKSDATRVQSAVSRPGAQAEMLLPNMHRSHAFAGVESLVRTGAEAGIPKTAAVDSGMLADARVFWSGGPDAVILLRFFGSGSFSSTRMPKMPYLALNTCVRARTGEWTLACFGPADIADTGSNAPCAVFVWPEPVIPTANARRDAVEEQTDDSRLRLALSRKTLTVNYSDIPLKAVLLDICARSGINMAVHPDVYFEFTEEEMVFSISLVDALISDILVLLLEQKGLGYCVKDGAAVVMPRQQADEANAVRVRVPVSDLVATLSDFSAERTGFTPSPDREEVMIIEDENDGPPVSGDWLMSLIRENIEPDSWDCPPNRITYRNMALVIEHQPEIVARAQRLISEFRERAISPVMVTGFLLDKLPPGIENAGGGSPVLSLESAAWVRDGIATGRIVPVSGFSCAGLCSRKFFIGAGNQALRPAAGGTKTDHWCEAFADGLSVEMRAANSGHGKEIALTFDARFSTMHEPDDPFEGDWSASSFSFASRTTLKRGQAVMISSSGPDSARKYLFVLVE